MPTYRIFKSVQAQFPLTPDEINEANENIYKLLSTTIQSKVEKNKFNPSYTNVITYLNNYCSTFGLEDASIKTTYCKVLQSLKEFIFTKGINCNNAAEQWKNDLDTICTEFQSELEKVLMKAYIVVGKPPINTAEFIMGQDFTENLISHWMEPVSHRSRCCIQ